MTDLTNDIQEQIRKNLPAQVGDALRAELIELTKLRQTCKDLLVSVDKTSASLKLAQAEVADLNYKLNKHQDLNNRETACAARELKLEISQVKLDCAELRVKDLKEITQVVFRSKTFTETVNGTLPVAVGGNAQCTGYVSQSNISTTRTVTE